MNRETKLILEALSSDAFLSVNKNLLRQFGPKNAIFISNLIDKYRYFLGRGEIQPDNSFFNTHEDQKYYTGMSDYELRQCKKFFKQKGILKTEMHGIPPKEFFIINFKELADSYISFKDNSSKNSRNEGKKIEGITAKNPEEYNENKFKDNKSNDKKNEKSKDFSEPSNNQNFAYKEYTEFLRKRLSEIHEHRTGLIPKSLKRKVTEKDCREMRLLYESDAFTNENIKEILEYLKKQEQKGDFLWINQIQSISGFRKHSEKVLVQAKTKEKSFAKKEKPRDGYYDKQQENPLY